MGSLPGRRSKPKPPNVAIVGGGLGGLCLAICLLHNKVPIHIYEAASTFGEIGAGIMFGPHAVNALRLISPEALAAFHKCVTFNGYDSMKSMWPTFLYGVDSKNGNGKKSGDLINQITSSEEVTKRCDINGARTMCTVHRARFLDEMVKLIPDGVASFSKTLDRVDQDAAGVTMYFMDGTTANADSVIGCDGIKSKVRSSIMSVEPRYANGYAYRSLVHMDVAKSILGEKLATNGTLWNGYGKYLINYPVEQGRLVNVVACIEDVGPQREHSIEQLVTPTSRDKMYEDWKDWDPRLQQLFREFKTSDRWSLWHLPHNEKYFKGRICLLGDSAHAAVPHLGSGAGMAVEDSFILGNLLASVTETKDLESAFAAYDAFRRPRTQQLVHKSMDSGRKHSFILKGVGDDLLALQAYGQTQYEWVWGHDLEKALLEAKAFMGKRGL